MAGCRLGVRVPTSCQDEVVRPTSGRRVDRVVPVVGPGRLLRPDQVAVVDHRDLVRIPRDVEAGRPLVGAAAAARRERRLVEAPAEAALRGVVGVLVPEHEVGTRRHVEVAHVIAVRLQRHVADRTPAVDVTVVVVPAHELDGTVDDRAAGAGAPDVGHVAHAGVPGGIAREGVAHLRAGEAGRTGDVRARRRRPAELDRGAVGAGRQVGALHVVVRVGAQALQPVVGAVVVDGSVAAVIPGDDVRAGLPAAVDAGEGAGRGAEAAEGAVERALVAGLALVHDPIAAGHELADRVAVAPDHAVVGAAVALLADLDDAVSAVGEELAVQVAGVLRLAVVGAVVALLARLDLPVAARHPHAHGVAGVARLAVVDAAVVALLADLDDAVAAAHVQAGAVAQVAGRAVGGTVVTVLALLDDPVAAGHELALEPAGIAQRAVAVAAVALLALLLDAVAAGDQVAGLGTGVAREAVRGPVVALLAVVEHAVAARLQMTAAVARLSGRAVGASLVALLAGAHQLVAAGVHDEHVEHEVARERGRPRLDASVREVVLVAVVVVLTDRRVDVVLTDQQARLGARAAQVAVEPAVAVADVADDLLVGLPHRFLRLVGAAAGAEQPEQPHEGSRDRHEPHQSHPIRAHVDLPVSRRYYQIVQGSSCNKKPKRLLPHDSPRNTQNQG